MSRTGKQNTGDWGEKKATLFLSNQGYEIIIRNYSARVGELDIIAWHKKNFLGKTLCFIEVKTRARKDGSAERATRGAKIGKILKVAKEYCFKNNIDIDSTPIQFEQVSVCRDTAGRVEIKHYVIPVD